MNRTLVRYGMKGLGVQNFGSEFASGEVPYFRRISHHLDRPGNAILDIGAHHGAFTAAVISCTRHVTVHAFEPSPASFQKLSALFSGEPRVILHGFAVGAADAAADLHDMIGSGGSERATLVEGILSTSRTQAIPVQVRALDGLDKLKGRVVFAKIDVEGFELQVLSGMRKLSASPEFLGAIVEFNTMNRAARVFLTDIAAALPGFAPCRVLPGGRVLPIDIDNAMFSEIFAYQNIAFERPGLRAS